MAEATTLIAAGTTVRGHLQGTEDLRIQGAVQGTISLDGTLTVDAGARVDAAVEVVNATIHGVLVGRVVAAEFIELSSTARMQGELVAPRVIVRDGAMFSGLIDAGDTPPTPGARQAPATPSVAAAPSPAARPAFPTSRPAPVVAVPRSVAPVPSPVAPPVATTPMPAPPVIRTAPVVQVAPEPEPAQPDPALAEIEREVLDDDDEPELPDAAAKKQVALKKRK